MYYTHTRTRLVIPRSTFIGLVMIVAWVMLTNIYRKFLFTRYLAPSASGELLAMTETEVALVRLAFVAGILLLFWVVALRPVRKEPLYWALALWTPLVGYMWLSIVWTSQSDGIVGLVLRHGNFTVQLLCVSFLSAAPVLIGQLFDSFRRLAVFACVVSLFLWIVGHPFGFFTTEYGRSFNGIFTHKGLLSNTAALAFLITWFRTGWKNLPVLAVCAATLMLASTISSIGGVLLAVLGIRHWRLALLLGGGFALLLPLVFPYFVWFFELLGKDPTLTGRTILWVTTLQQRMPTWLIGNGFVDIANTETWVRMMNDYFTTDSFLIPHAHNLWIEGFYKFGVIGVGLLFWILVVTPTFAKSGDLDDWVTRTSIAVILYTTVKTGLTLPFLVTGGSSILYAVAVTSLAIAGTAKPSKSET